MELFKQDSSDAKTNAQRNLCGRTHYVDEGTLRWHKCRILSTHVVDRGLLFAITTSDALNMNNTRRGFRYVIFDLFGTVLSRPDLEHAFKRHDQARKAMWAALNAIDAKAHTLTAIHDARKAYATEMDRLVDNVAAIATAQVAGEKVA